MLLFGLKSTLLGSGVIMNRVLYLLFLFLDTCFKLFMFLTRHFHCVLSFILRIHNVFEVEINIGLLGDLTVGDCIDEFMGEPTREFKYGRTTGLFRRAYFGANWLAFLLDS